MSWNLKDLEDRFLIGSTLVEGSTLTETEARSVLKGRTVSGHPIAEIRELQNYHSAVEWLIRLVERSPYISQDLILQFHHRLFDGLTDVRGRFKSNQNFTFRSDGSRFEYVKPGRVAGALSKWLAEFNADAREPPASQAAQLYYGFEHIHPFDDGNGRIGRILVSYWLHWKHQLAFSFYAKDKVDHLNALEAANDGNLGPLESLFTDRTQDES